MLTDASKPRHNYYGEHRMLQHIRLHMHGGSRTNTNVKQLLTQLDNVNFHALGQVCAFVVMFQSLAFAWLRVGKRLHTPKRRDQNTSI